VTSCSICSSRTQHAHSGKHFFKPSQELRT